MRTLVKICGVRTIDAAKTAVDQGADFIGFNFAPTSRRLISLKKASEIAAELRGRIKIVGVFRNQERAYVNSIVSDLGLDFIQLHGDEDSKFAKSINAKVIKSFSTNDEELDKKILNYSADYFLLDRKIQGEGELVNLEKAKKIAGKFNIFLAGGLNPENIFEIVRKVRPFAVDVAGGVETDGRQDLEKIKDFIKNAKEAIV